MHQNMETALALVQGDYTLVSRKRSRRSQYSDMNLANLLHPQSSGGMTKDQKLHRSTSDLTYENANFHSSFKKVAPCNAIALSRSQHEKELESLAPRKHPSRVEELRKVFEEKEQDASNRKNTRIRRSHRRHTVSGATFKLDPEPSSDSDDQVVNQVLNLLGRHEHVVSNHDNNRLNQDYQTNMEQIHVQSNVKDKPNDNFSSAEPKIFPQDKFNSLQSINSSSLHATTGIHQSNKTHTITTVTQRRRRKNRSLYAEVRQEKLLNADNAFDWKNENDEIATSHLSIVTSTNAFYNRRSGRNEKNSLNTADENTSGTSTDHHATKLPYNNNATVNKHLNIEKKQVEEIIKELSCKSENMSSVATTTRDREQCDEHNSSSDSTDQTVELISSEDEDSCLNFYGRYDKKDFESPTNDKYNTFLDLSKLECLPASGLSTLEEEKEDVSSNCDDSGIISPKIVENQEEMGSSASKILNSQVKIEEISLDNDSSKFDRVRNESQVSNDDFIDCKDELTESMADDDSSKLNTPKHSCRIVSVSPAEGICTSPDSDSVGALADDLDSTQELNSNDVFDKEQQEGNDHPKSIFKDEINKTFDSAIVADFDEKLTLDENGNVLGNEEHDDEKKQNDKVASDAVVKITSDLQSSPPQLNQQPAVVRRKDALFKRRERSYRRVSDPTGIVRDGGKLFFNSLAAAKVKGGHGYSNGVKRLYEIVIQATKTDGPVRVVDIYKIFEDKGIRKSDPRLHEIEEIVKKSGEDSILNEEIFSRICHVNFELTRNVLLSQLTIPGYQCFKQRMQRIYDTVFACLTKSKNAIYAEGKQYSDSTSYLSVMMQRKTMLDKPDILSMSVCTVDGQRISFGDKEGLYTLNNCANVFNYCMACSRHGGETLHWYLGRSATPKQQQAMQEYTFDSKGRVWNPFTKAGAIMTSSLLLRKEAGDDLSSEVHEFYRRLTGNESLCCDNLSYNLKRMFGHEEISLAYFLSAQKKLPPFAVTSPSEALEMSFQSTCTATTCDSCSVAAATIAGLGICPLTDERVIPEKIARNAIKTINLCSEDFCKKSGMVVSWSELGSVMVIIPGVMGITCFTQCQHPSTMRHLVSTLIENLSSEVNFALYRSLRETRNNSKFK